MIEQFQQYFEQYTAEFSKKQALSSRIGWLRLILFIAGITMTVWYIHLQFLWVAALLLFSTSLSFALLVNKHNKVRRQAKLLVEKASINQEEIQRLNLNFENLEDGQVYSDQHHAYCQDLDLVGRHSIFQFIHRKGTDLGSHALAHMLLYPVPIAAAKKRQHSIRELCDRVSWRQAFQAHARLVDHEKTAHEGLLKWSKEDNPLLKKPYFLKLVIALSAIIPTLSIAGIILGWTALAILGLMTINGLLWRSRFASIQRHKSSTEHHIKLLKSYAELFKLIDEMDVKSDRLTELKTELAGVHVMIKKLHKAFEYLDYSNNALFGILANGFFNWDIIWCYRIERWKHHHAVQSEQWFTSLGEFEALSAVAATAYAQPDWTWPELNDNVHGLKGTDIAHPLIPNRNRVANTYELSGSGMTHLLTGSNMSGKSTFLRTIGINVVLARAGFPVCASSFSCGPVRLFTSMRTTDSIEESTSSFYAELKRLKQLIELAESENYIVYLLDEILKGTNSKDRHLGAKALVKQLSGLQATGIVSTHDIELSDMATSDQHVSNYSFNSTIQGDHIQFDYTLTTGPCRSFNASKLMEKMGFNMKLSESELIL